MKIIHVLTDSNIGGAGILLESLLQHTGIPLSDFCVLLPRDARMAERYAALGVRVCEAAIRPDTSLAPRDLPILLRFLYTERPDILHTHGALGARIAATLARVPIRLATRHCAYPVGPLSGSLPLRLLHGGLDRCLTTLTVATAEAAADNLVALGIPRTRILTIRNGARALTPLSPKERYAARARLGIGEEDFVIGMAARLVAVKGHDILLSAAKILLSQHTGYRFLIIGGGVEEERLRKAAARPPLDGRVLLLGEVADVSLCLGVCDVAVNCSRGTETACLALSEAMSLGLPCVASDYGGNPELVRDGENGLLFPTGDAAALAACLTRLRTDRALYARLSCGALVRFREALSAPRMAATYDRLYRRLYEENLPARKARANG